MFQTKIVGVKGGRSMVILTLILGLKVFKVILRST